MGYFRNALIGTGWMGSLRVITRGLSFVKLAILARILTPNDFGIFGISLITLAFLETLTETGINIFFIQEDKDIKDYLNTAWVISIIRGIIIGLLIILSAPLVSSFFAAEKALPLIQLMGMVAIIRGFINPAIVKFQKNLEFSKEFSLRTSIIIFEATAMVTFTLITRSAISLIYGLVASAIFEVILSFLVVKPRARLAFDLQQFKAIYKRGKWVTVGGVLGYLTRQGDDAVVAKLLNTSALGLYQMAYRLSIIPGTEITDVLSKVTFPVYSKISDDKKRIFKAYSKTLISITGLVIPVSLILILFPELVIKIVLGNQWLAAAPALRVLAIFGAISSLVGSRNALLFALKRQDIATKITLVRFIVLAVTIIPLTLSQGIIGAAIASLVSVLSIAPLTVYYFVKIYKQS